MSKFRYCFITNQFIRFLFVYLQQYHRKRHIPQRKSFLYLDWTYFKNVFQHPWNVLEFSLWPRDCNFNTDENLYRTLSCLLITATLWQVNSTIVLYEFYSLHQTTTNRPPTTYSPTQRLIDPPNTNPLINWPNTHPHKRQYSTKETWQ